MHWIQKRGKKYRVWSTIADDWLTCWGTRQQAINYFAARWRKDTEERIKEMKKTFPR